MQKNPTVEKIIDVMEQIKTCLTLEEYQNYFRGYISTFTKKVEDNQNRNFLDSVTLSIEEVFGEKDDEKKLAGILMMINLIKHIDRGIFDNFMKELEERIIPRIFENFFAMKKSLLQSESNFSKNELFSHNLKIMKITLLATVKLFEAIVENCSRFYDVSFFETNLEKLNYPNLENYRKEFSYIVFDIFEERVDFFKKQSSTVIKKGNFNQMLMSLLEEGKTTRKRIYEYLLEKNQPEELDNISINYGKTMQEIQTLIKNNPNEFNNINAATIDSIQREMIFSNYLLNESINIAQENELSLNEAMNLNIEKYKEIFPEEFESERIKNKITAVLKEKNQRDILPVKENKKNDLFGDFEKDNFNEDDFSENSDFGFDDKNDYRSSLNEAKKIKSETLDFNKNKPLKNKDDNNLFTLKKQKSDTKGNNYADAFEGFSSKHDNDFDLSEKKSPEISSEEFVFDTKKKSFEINPDEFNFKKSITKKENFQDMFKERSQSNQGKKEVINAQRFTDPFTKKNTEGINEDEFLDNSSQNSSSEELKSKKLENGPKKTFLSYFEDDKNNDIMKFSQMKNSRGSFNTNSIRERFKNNKLNLSGIEKKDGSSFFERNSNTQIFLANKGKVMSKLDVLSNSNFSNTNKNLLKNAMRNTTILGQKSNVIKPRTQNVVIIKPSPPPIQMTQTQNFNDKIEKSPEISQSNLKKNISKTEYFDNKKYSIPIAQEEEALNFDDFPSEKHISNVVKKTINHSNDILPQNLKESLLKAQREKKREPSPDPFENDTHLVSPFIPKEENSFNLETPFDTESKKFDFASKSVDDNLNMMKEDYNNQIKKQNHELQLLSQKKKNQKTDFNNFQNVMDEKIKQYETFFLKIQNENRNNFQKYQKTLETLNSENQRLNDSNDNLQNKIFVLENQIKDFEKMNKMLNESIKNERFRSNSELEAMKRNLEYKEIKIKKKDDNLEEMKSLLKNKEKELLNLSEKNSIIKNQLKNFETQIGINSNKEILKENVKNIKMNQKLLEEELKLNFNQLNFEIKNLKSKKNILSQSEKNESKLFSSNNSNYKLRKGYLQILKKKIINLKSINESSFEKFQMTLDYYKNLFKNLKKKKNKKQILENQFFDLQILNNSNIEQINRLHLQNEMLKEENQLLNKKNQTILNEKKNLQNEMFDITNIKGNFLNLSSNYELNKKMTDLEMEKNSLLEFNKKIADENLELKEKVIRLQINNDSEKLLFVIKNLEKENEDIFENNKKLLEELSEIKTGENSYFHLIEKVTRLEKENFYLKNMSQNKKNSNVLIFSNQTVHNNNIKIEEKNEIIENKNEIKNNKGTAFIKKFDLYLDILNSEKKKTEDVNFFEYLQKSNNKKSLAIKCLNSSYSILKNNEFNFFVEESISKKNDIIEIKLILKFSNFSDQKLHVLNFNLLSVSKFIKIEKNITPFNLEISPMQMMNKKITIFAEENYLLEFQPIFFNFCLLDQNKMQIYLKGQNLNIVEENIKQFILPLSINKLLTYIKENSTTLNLLKKLALIGEIKYEKDIKLTKEDLFFIFPNLTEFEGENQEDIFLVKILSVYGSNLVQVIFEEEDCVTIRLFSMYENPVNMLYLDTLRFILDNF